MTRAADEPLERSVRHVHVLCRVWRDTRARVLAALEPAGRQDVTLEAVFLDDRPQLACKALRWRSPDDTNIAGPPAFHVRSERAAQALDAGGDGLPLLSGLIRRALARKRHDVHVSARKGIRDGRSAGRRDAICCVHLHRRDTRDWHPSCTGRRRDGTGRPHTSRSAAAPAGPCAPQSAPYPRRPFRSRALWQPRRRGPSPPWRCRPRTSYGLAAHAVGGPQGSGW